MIIGRNAEIKYLNNYYDHDGSQIVVVYGQKNIGKTSLTKQFVQDKPCYYYNARSASEREQLYLWGREMAGFGIKVPRYPTFTDIFYAISKNDTGKRVFIIDEFQNIVKNSPNFMKELVQFVHHNWNNTQVMIILCSSSTGFIENNLIDKIGDSAYELSGFLKVKELEFSHMLEYFQGFRMDECIEAYAILGGTPGLWKNFDDKLSIKENICKKILDKQSILREMGEQIVSEELRETGVYDTILSAIASGNHKLNDLYIHTGFSRAKISVYLKNLMELEIVEKIFSYDTDGKENVQKGIYAISNHFVHFYFTYIYPNMSRLEAVTPQEFYKAYIAPSLKSYTEEYFKNVCFQYMNGLNEHNRLPIQYRYSGVWVGKVGNIDIVAQDDDNRCIVGICNWDKPMMTYEDYEWLIYCCKQAKLTPDYIYLFSGGRFDEKLNLEAKVKHNIKLIGVDEL